MRSYSLSTKAIYRGAVSQATALSSLLISFPSRLRLLCGARGPNTSPRRKARLPSGDVLGKVMETKGNWFGAGRPGEEPEEAFCERDIST